MRRYRALAWLTLAFGVTACSEPAPESNGPANQVPAGILPATQLEPGWTDALQNALPTGLDAVVTGSDNNELLLFQIDSSQLDPVLVTSPDNGISALRALEDSNAKLIIGSGFVSEAHSLTPVGLLQIEGRVLNPVQVHGYTRILGINDQTLGVVHRKDYERGLFHSALQVGPGIVEEGQLDISKRDLLRPRYFRSFIAVCADRWIAGVSLAPIHLRTLGEVFLAFRDRESLQCNEVVNLAGDRQAVLLARFDDGRIFTHGDPNTHKLSLLGFIPTN